ncbi:MAG: hypothetical protein RBG13Loki_3203 [Promethearchaeota archaeon CR_4]|nr:MAG: hypothetical protein RBG13Loki_3203 [Candidatus Lokiarchaeota archaeon CR_4]
MTARYSFVSLVKGVAPREYRDILAASLLLAKKTLHGPDSLKDGKMIEEIENVWGKWAGKFYPGGQSTLWAMRFVHAPLKDPQIIKCFHKFNPYMLMNHVASAEAFVEDFPTPIDVRGKKLLIRPAKNLALAQFEGEDQFTFHVQQFSPGNLIPPTLPIGDICKTLSVKGYTVDAFPRNWRLQENLKTGEITIEYIDLVFRDNICQQQEKLQSLVTQLKQFQFSLTRT